MNVCMYVRPLEAGASVLNQQHHAGHICMCMHVYVCVFMCMNQKESMWPVHALEAAHSAWNNIIRIAFVRITYINTRMPFMYQKKVSFQRNPPFFTKQPVPSNLSKVTGLSFILWLNDVTTQPDTLLCIFS